MGCDSVPAMITPADYQRLKKRVLRIVTLGGFAPSRWCLAAGLSQNLLGNFLRTENREINLASQKKLTAVLGYPASVLTLEMTDKEFLQLLKDQPPGLPESQESVRNHSSRVIPFVEGEDSSDENLAGPLPVVPLEVVGEVQAGAWREAMEWPADERFIEYVAVDDRFPGSPMFGLRVRGLSMDKDYPEGTILVCIRMAHYPHALGDGDHVIVQRVGEASLVEATVKELSIGEDGEAWLVPNSTRKEHQAPIHFTVQPEDEEDAAGIERVQIVAVVVSAQIRREPRKGRRVLDLR